RAGHRDRHAGDRGAALRAGQRRTNTAGRLCAETGGLHPMKQRGGAQYPLELAHAETYAAADCRISECNRDALGWLDKWPAWPAPALVIYGPAGCGKTHLARMWQEKSAAHVLDDVPDAAEMAQLPAALVVEDAERFAGNAEGERALFHL